MSSVPLRVLVAGCCAWGCSASEADDEPLAGSTSVGQTSEVADSAPEDTGPPMSTTGDPSDASSGTVGDASTNSGTDGGDDEGDDATGADDTGEAPPTSACDPAYELPLGVPAAPHTGRVTAIYLVPSDQVIDEVRARFYACAIEVVADWYRTKSGRTFDHAFGVVQSAASTAEFACAQANDITQCDASIRQALQADAVPFYTDGTNFTVALQGNLVHWGGAKVDTPSGGGFSFVGSDLFFQLTDQGCAPAECTTVDQGLGIAHDGDYITGGIAHELGHSFGLPHPDPAVPGATQSVMLEHWHFPSNEFLATELATLAANPLLHR